uniref:Ribosomal protein S10 domain-containing protein n=1 Tax=Ditylenchus dipsaci TaxID=166011 RepID=A0A915EGX7_9BILA
MFIIRRIVPNASFHLRTFSSLSEAQLAKARNFKTTITCLWRDISLMCIERQRFRVQRHSRLSVSEINLTLYDRWIRIDNVTALFFPIFLTLIQSHAPIGTIVTVKAHEKEDEDYRYIPDVHLKAKIEELKSLDDPETRKILGWE